MNYQTGSLTEEQVKIILEGLELLSTTRPEDQEVEELRVLFSDPEKNLILLDE